jgi:hypothetical protein
MRASLTAFGAQVLAEIIACGPAYNEFKSPTSLANALGVPLRDMVNTLNWLKDLGLVDEKPWYEELLDGRYYPITKLGCVALEQYQADKGAKTLPRPKL